MKTSKARIEYQDGVTVHVRDGRGVLEFIVQGGGLDTRQCAELERRLAAGEMKPEDVQPAPEVVALNRRFESDDQRLVVIQRTAAHSGPDAHWTDMVDDEGGWLRHHPTQVIIRKEGRSDAETLAHLADVLASHHMITEAERAACHPPEDPASPEP